MGQTGSFAPNFHQGKRSEYLAQYFFSSLGTAVPVPMSEDFGLDLHCTIADVVGQRAWPRCFFTVQVKSEFKPWQFQSEESVRWVSVQPFPMFLCIVEKKEGRVRVYQTLGRHHVQANPPLPSQLELVPGEESKGTVYQWNWHKEKAQIQLNAPILDFTLAQFLDDSFTELAKDVIAAWSEWDKANTQMRGSGVFQLKVPTSYRTNERLAPTGVASGGAMLTGEGLRPAIENVIQNLEYVADCVCLHGDKGLGVRMLLLIRRLQGSPHLLGAFPILKELCGHLGLPRPVSGSNPLSDYFAGLDKIDAAIEASLPAEWRSELPPVSSSATGPWRPPKDAFF